jgi:glyoxylase-like metal-dependent hydrolase (beta-lactamase superfamily II)
MPLEDHWGDVLHKARAMNGVSTAAAAAAGEISEAELSALETSGRRPGKINFPALGKLLGLDAGRLAALANGWLPAAVDLCRWRELRELTTRNDQFSVNCYLVWDGATRDAALFDTGLDAQPVLECLAAAGLALRHIFITHAHWDHVQALPEIRAAFPRAQLHAGLPPAPADPRNPPDETLPLGGLRVTHRATPGHTEDGVTYLVRHWPENAPAIAVVGDALFSGSMGRGNQSWTLARQSLREQILSLPPETLICPGHGPLTTVAEETAHNPFF